MESGRIAEDHLFHLLHGELPALESIRQLPQTSRHFKTFPFHTAELHFG
jgi:hypothetical protein